MADGYFSVRTGIYNEAMPISGAIVYIKEQGSDIPDTEDYNPQIHVSKDNYDFLAVTDENGKTLSVRLTAPLVEYSFGQADSHKAYSQYDVLVVAEGFVPIFVKGIRIFPGVSGELPINLEPYVESFPKDYVKIYSPTKESPEKPTSRAPEGPDTTITTDILSEIVIPSSITIHLGAPSDSSAANVSVPFADYVKNVASGEIFPTWNEEALRANIYAQISFALNRVYTEWYPSRGYPFQITSSTAYDQSYSQGRTIYDNISRITDEIFNVFLRKDNNYEPFFAQYCDGIKTTCNGLSQWGSQRLAERGYTAIAILKNYYGDTISLASTDNIRDAPMSYPGVPQSLGSVGKDVIEMQIQLDRIRQDYPLIPKITRLNGRFGTETDSAVRAFQNIFNLAVDGIVGKATWYKISRIYSAVTRLAEITSEGTQTFVSEEIPQETLSKGSEGDNTRLLQFILEYLSFFYPEIPSVIVDGSFGQNTENSVIGFQKTFGLTQDGIVGEETWKTLYSVSGEINRAVSSTNQEQKYPGEPIAVGDTGKGAELMKRYYNRIAEFYRELPTVAENDIFDEEFENAVMLFQEKYNLVPNGIIDALTWTRIVEIYNFIKDAEKEAQPTIQSTVRTDIPPYPSIILRRGANGRHVKLLQNALNIINKKNGKKQYIPISGEFNYSTEQAILDYQKSHGLARSGGVNKEIWNRIMTEAEEGKAFL